MTEKLYYADSKLRSFNATIVARAETERGPAVQLDRTAFYPTGGGQAHDTGTLNGIPVRDVWADDEGEVWHLLDRLPTGDAVQGELDWARRFDHMQQHTGQHLLSAAFLRRFNANTLSVHFGAEENTVDLDLPQLTWEAAFKVEDEVNRIIWDDRPVEARFVTGAELAQMDVRREPQVEDHIRIVRVAGFDATPCGGTHVERTGEIGLVKLTGVSSYKGGVRVAFLCGKRALHDYRRAFQLLETLKRTLTVGQDELPDAVARLQDELKEHRRALHEAREALSALEAERLWEQAPTVEGVKHIVAYWSHRPFESAQAVARQLREHPNTLILLATGGDGSLRLLCARSDDVDANATEILRAAAEPLGARGGGSPVMAQGGGPPVEADRALSALNAALDS
ncbi:MAG: alanyl-tRNA editing protein [Anaerolineae bacterium]